LPGHRTVQGDHFEVLDGGFRGALGGQTVPPVYLSGTSDAELRLSARIADVHVLDALPASAIDAAVGKLRAFARESGRPVAAGLRVDLLARETEEEATRDARRYDEQSNGGRQTAIWQWPLARPQPRAPRAHRRPWWAVIGKLPTP
jgi:alkanesulfonate monooxygenase